MSDLLTKTQEILADRQIDYGNSNEMLETIARYWTNYLYQQFKYDKNIVINSNDVAIMMILMKIAREGYNPKQDNRIDIAGYTYILDKLSKE